MNGSSSTFNREERYAVFKRKDMYLYLTPAEQEMVWKLIAKIARGRVDANRGNLDCVVVEHDWPEAEAVWSMIEARMTGGLNFVDWQAARITELEREVAELKQRLSTTEVHINAE